MRRQGSHQQQHAAQCVDTRRLPVMHSVSIDDAVHRSCLVWINNAATRSYLGWINDAANRSYVWCGLTMLLTVHT